MFIGGFLTQIEQSIFKLSNTDLIEHVLSKERDDTYKFKSMIAISHKNI